MALTLLTRNLRDGVLVVGDGSEKTATLTLENGDLTWSVPEEDTIEIKDRGELDHIRAGDKLSGSISYSIMWVHLIGASVTSSADADQLYEMVNNQHDFYTSTSAAGQKFTLQHAFLVQDPAAGSTTDEKIVFDLVYKTDCTASEGDESNTINFDGINFVKKPTVERQ